MLNDWPRWLVALVFVVGLWTGGALSLLVLGLFARNRNQAPCEDCWLLECYQKQGQELQRAWGVANAALDPKKTETRP